MHVYQSIINTVKPVLSSHSKKTKKIVFKTSNPLMSLKRIAECTCEACCNTFDQHLETTWP